MSKENVPDDSSVVVVEADARQKYLTRPDQADDGVAEVHRQRSRAPAVISVAEELKNMTEDISENMDLKEKKSSVHDKDKRKHSYSKLPTSKKASPMDTNSESLQMKTLNMDAVLQPAPIQPDTEDLSALKELSEQNKPSEKKLPDEDIVEDNATDLQAAEAEREHSDWSDDNDEAGGLSHSASRASRVARAVRHLLCCNLAYEVPSEDELTSPRSYRDGV